MDFEVRRIRADEWRAYRELRLEALRDSPLAFVEQYAESVARPDEFWQDRVERGAAGAASCLYVAGRDDGFVAKASGFVEADVTDHVSVHVVGVYTTPRMRGHGVSEAVVSAVIRWATEEARADRVRLFVTQANGRAAAFYRRLGFVFTGTIEPYPPDPSQSEHEMLYKG
jgi:ribosomal protein S18 acetylase RimI-like enzyme